MPYNPASVVSYGFPMDDFTFTYLITGLADAAAVAAAPGKAVSQDTSAASSVKLIAAGEEIFGRVFQAEDRTGGGIGFKTAAVQRRFKEKLPAATGHGIAVGDRVVGGAIAGNVAKAGALPAGQHTVVVETGTDFVVVEKL